MTSWVIFTDLDESLLDRETYSFEAARPALEEVRRRSIPIVFCTSKTAAETRRLQDLLGLREPFIVESGAAIGVPAGYFDGLPGPTVERGDHRLLPLAAGGETIRRAWRRLVEISEDSVRGFCGMTDEEVARETGLPLETAALARRREFDEPFFFLRDEAALVPRLQEAAREMGLRISRGGRFYHLHGDTDKGRAVEVLKSLFRRKLGGIRTIGVGDSAMDLPLLQAVDVPIAVLRRDGTHDPVLAARVPELRPVPAPGPAGWSAGVLAALGE